MPPLPSVLATRPASGPAPAAVAAVGLLALAVAMGIGRFAFTPILPMMQQDEGLSVAAGAWLASANYAGYLLGAVSAMALRVRPAAAMRGGLLAIGIVTVGMGLSHEFAVWAAFRLLAGVGSAWVLVFASAWSLERLTAVPRPLLSGVVFAGVGTGIALAGMFCLVLMHTRATSAQAWLGLGVFSLVATASIWGILAADAQSPRAECTGVAAPAFSSNASFGRLVACYGAFGFAYIIPGTFLPLMARQAIQDPTVFGWSWPLFGAAAAVTPLAAAVLSRLVGNRRVWMLSHLVMALGVALPVWWPGIGGVMIAALLVGGTFMVITLAGMQEARAVAGARATRLMAAMTSAFAIGQILGPISVGYLVGAGGDFARPLLVAAVVLLASAWALGRGPARERSGRSRTPPISWPR